MSFVIRKMELFEVFILEILLCIGYFCIYSVENKEVLLKDSGFCVYGKELG